MKTINLSVKDLATPIIKRGSLSYEGVFSSMEMGSEIHRSLQKDYETSYGDDYQKEFSLKDEFIVDEIKFVVSGRVDGYFKKDEILEEIKSTFSLDKLSDQIEENIEHPYVLQLKTYGYLFYLLNGIMPKLRLLLVHTLNRKKRYLDISISEEDFKDWILKKLQSLVKHEKNKQKNKARRKTLAKKIFFPFEDQRPFQKELMALVESTTKAKKSALLQAPTGIGKTIGVLFPLLVDSLKRGMPLIYLTPKNSQFEVVKKTVQLFHQKEIPLRILVLTAKTKICLNTVVQCNKESCQFADKYYDKIEENNLRSQYVEDLIADKSSLENLGEKYKVCPYELAFEELWQFDIIVGDYNYVFSRRAALASFFADKEHEGKINLIVDEAHNLYQRGREYYSPEITKDQVQQFFNLSHRPSIPNKIKKFTHTISKFYSHYCFNENKNSEIEILDSDWFEIENEFRSLIFPYLESVNPIDLEDEFFSLYFSVKDFLETLEYKKFITTVYIKNYEEDKIKGVCCDPSFLFGRIYKLFNSVVGFSATLKPFDFYKKVSGFDEETIVEEFQSGFPSENRKIILIPQVSTFYKEREKSIPKLVEGIDRISKIKKGGYICFFPSFEYLEQVRAKMAHLDIPIYWQKRHSKPDEISELLNILKHESSPYYLFAVQGGVLSEGIDIHSSNLLGTFIVGPALQAINFETNLVSKYFDEKFNSGFNYAYIYPAMAKSIQASGRIIRSEKKKGLIVFFDRRFIHKDYTEAFPRFWYQESVKELVITNILNQVESFWQEE